MAKPQKPMLGQCDQCGKVRRIVLSNLVKDFCSADCAAAYLRSEGLTVPKNLESIAAGASPAAVGATKPGSLTTMSWYLNIMGTKANVKARVLAEEQIPQPVKDAIALFCDTPVTPEAYALHVETSGHYSATDGFSNLQELKVNPIQLAKAPKVETPQAENGQATQTAPDPVATSQQG